MNFVRRKQQGTVLLLTLLHSNLSIRDGPTVQGHREDAQYSILHVLLVGRNNITAIVTPLTILDCYNINKCSNFISRPKLNPNIKLLYIFTISLSALNFQ